MSNLEVSVQSENMVAALVANPKQLAYLLAELPKEMGNDVQQEVFKFLQQGPRTSPDTAAFWSHVAETMMDRHL